MRDIWKSSCDYAVIVQIDKICWFSINMRAFHLQNGKGVGIIRTSKRIPPIEIKELAEILGVSRGTVDRALHNRGEVSPEIRELVLS